MATFNTELARDGPGLLVRDLVKGNSEDILAVLDALEAVQPDIVLLLDIDHDHDHISARMLRDALKDRGLDYPYFVAERPNSGLRTTLDLNGDGRIGDPQDAQGFGYFAGQGGMLLLSKLRLGEVRDHSDVLWADVANANPPRRSDGQLFPSDAAFARQRLAYVAHWQIPVLLPRSPPLTLTALHATPPVFDGPEDQNGRRNADELGYALAMMPDTPLALIGTLNLDPFDSEGQLSAIHRVLAHPALQDPLQSNDLGREKTQRDGKVNSDHSGDPRLDTADWTDTGPGNLRVDYVLPGAKFDVVASGLHWPASGRRAVVWADIRLP